MTNKNKEKKVISMAFYASIAIYNPKGFFEAVCIRVNDESNTFKNTLAQKYATEDDVKKFIAKNAPVAHIYPDNTTAKTIEKLIGACKYLFVWDKDHWNYAYYDKQMNEIVLEYKQLSTNRGN